MIYLVRYDMTGAEIAACEREAAAARYEDQGYRRETYAQFRLAWQARDAPVLARIREEDAPDTRHKIVGALPGKVYPKTETGL